MPATPRSGADNMRILPDINALSIQLIEDHPDTSGNPRRSRRGGTRHGEN